MPGSNVVAYLCYGCHGVLSLLLLLSQVVCGCWHCDDVGLDGEHVFGLAVVGCACARCGCTGVRPFVPSYLGPGGAMTAACRWSICMWMRADVL